LFLLFYQGKILFLHFKNFHRSIFVPEKFLSLDLFNWKKGFSQPSMVEVVHRSEIRNWRFEFSIVSIEPLKNSQLLFSTK
jgi:hypothetical protein